MKSKNLKYFYILFIAFLISANIAWLNPSSNDPEKPRLYKTHNKIPLFWQYNLDAGIEILTAAYFPKIFEVNNIRIDRPTYPATANLFGKLIGFISKPFIDLNNLEKAGIGYLILKILVYCSSIILARKILLLYFDEMTTFLAIFFAYTNAFSIFYFTAFHTTELQFITPIFVLSMFLYLIKNYSFIKNILFSIIVGILMLAKPNYAVYLSIIIFLFYKQKWSIIFVSIISHLIPILIYLSIIKYLKYDLQVTGATDYDQGVWLYKDFVEGNFYIILQTFYFQLGEFFIKIFSGYKLLFFFAIFGFIFKYSKNEINRDHLIFLGIFIFCTYFQMFVASRYSEYMNKDFSIIIYAFAAYGIYQILSKVKRVSLKKSAVPLIMFMYLVFEITTFVNLPWVHPYNQVAKKADVLNSKLNKLDNIIIKD